MRLGLAFRAFFRVLFGRPLPDELLLPASTSPAGIAPKPVVGDARSDGAVELLRLLQREGRLVDFLREDVSGYADEQVGAAVRSVHEGCRRVLESYIGLDPVIDGDEDGPITVEDDFDPACVELVGNVGGNPPFRGVLRHHGWRVSKVELPGSLAGTERVVAPAEVEIK
jgi:hypothetical protein